MMGGGLWLWFVGSLFVLSAFWLGVNFAVCITVFTRWHGVFVVDVVLSAVCYVLAVDFTFFCFGECVIGF